MGVDARIFFTLASGAARGSTKPGVEKPPPIDGWFSREDPCGYGTDMFSPYVGYSNLGLYEICSLRRYYASDRNVHRWPGLRRLLVSLLKSPEVENVWYQSDLDIDAYCYEQGKPCLDVLDAFTMTDVLYLDIQYFRHGGLLEDLHQ